MVEHERLSPMMRIARALYAITFLGMPVFAAGTDPTFTKDVLPILQAKCQECHRPGQVAPMSFLDYQSVRPWAKAMKAAVVSRKMPPWFADPKFGPYVNDHSLTQEEIDIIAK